MGGTLELESVYGTGTKAILTIPVKAVEVEMEVPQTPVLDSPISPTSSRRDTKMDFLSSKSIFNSLPSTPQTVCKEPIKRMKLRRVQTTIPPPTPRRSSLFDVSPVSAVSDTEPPPTEARKAVTVLIVEDK